MRIAPFAAALALSLYAASGSAKLPETVSTPTPVGESIPDEEEREAVRERRMGSGGDIAKAFDSTEIIRRYLKEARPTDEEPLVVNNQDQTTRMDVESEQDIDPNDPGNVRTHERRRLTAGTMISTLKDPNSARWADVNADMANVERADREQVQALLRKIGQIQHEYRDRRKAEVQKYDHKAAELYTALQITERYGEAKRARRQAEINAELADMQSKHQARIERLRKDERDRVLELRDEIARIKGERDRTREMERTRR